MSEVYSELWVKINCQYDAEQETKIRRAWQCLLAEYKKYRIRDDTQGEMFLEDGINFGIGAEDSKTDEPDYESQYEMFGKFVWAIQEILVEWVLDMHIQKTGASG